MASETTISVDLRGEYSSGPYQDKPFISVWIGSEFFYFAAGEWRRRWKWLPTWFPFNVWLDNRPGAIVSKMKWVRKWANEIQAEREASHGK